MPRIRSNNGSMLLHGCMLALVLIIYGILNLSETLFVHLTGGQVLTGNLPTSSVSATVPEGTPLTIKVITN